MQDELDALERAEHFRPDESVRIGNQSYHHAPIIALDIADRSSLLTLMTMLNDAHCHFFSSRFFETLAPELGSADETASRLQWDPPGTATDLGDRWIAEFDRHGVQRAALMASVPGDAVSVAEAVAHHPHRLVGFFMHNPLILDAAAALDRAFGDLQMRAACLFPAMHGYRADDECVEPVFRAAAAHGAAVFVHCGVLSIGVRKKLGLPSRFDLRLGDPLAVSRLAIDFPQVPVIVPHFGAGYFREALMAAEQCPTIHLDTSSSNGWMRFHDGLTLERVFRTALGVVGPSRLLFGTDSSFFPRGWQKPIYDEQQRVAAALGLSKDDAAAIFGGNFDRLFAQ
jgi:predicted TIM-barrel fold metal-dependent hydrolase